MYLDEPFIGWSAACMFEVGEKMMGGSCSAGNRSILLSKLVLSLGIDGVRLNENGSHPWYPHTSTFWCTADLDAVNEEAGGGLGSTVIPGTYPVSEFTGLLCDTGEQLPSSCEEVLHEELV